MVFQSILPFLNFYRLSNVIQLGLGRPLSISVNLRQSISTSAYFVICDKQQLEPTCKSTVEKNSIATSKSHIMCIKAYLRTCPTKIFGSLPKIFVKLEALILWPSNVKRCRRSCHKNVSFTQKFNKLQLSWRKSSIPKHRNLKKNKL